MVIEAIARGCVEGVMRHLRSVGVILTRFALFGSLEEPLDGNQILRLHRLQEFLFFPHPVQSHTQAPSLTHAVMAILLHPAHLQGTRRPNGAVNASTSSPFIVKRSSAQRGARRVYMPSEVTSGVHAVANDEKRSYCVLR